MRSLILFRHAKSDWDANYANDRGRPLSERGIKAARRMGKLLQAMEQVPELVICSTARRALETLDIASRQGQWECDARESDALYETSPDNVLILLRRLDVDPESLMLVGHEPTWSMLASRLIGRDCALRVPTACMLRIDLEIDAWQNVGFQTGRLRWMLAPKLLGRLRV